MGSRKRNPQQPDDVFLGELVDYLYEQREAGRCHSPLSTRMLEQLLDDALDPVDTQRARLHIAACLFCLSAYAELAATGESVSAAAAPMRDLAAQPPARDLNRLAADLRHEVEQLTAEIEQTLRRLPHRSAHPRSPGQAAPFAEAPSVFSPSDQESEDESSEGDESGSRPMASSTEDLLGKLRFLDRVFRQRLRELHTVRRLVILSDELVTKIDGAKLAHPIRWALISALESQRRPLVELAESMAAWLTRQ